MIATAGAIHRLLLYMDRRVSVDLILGCFEREYEFNTNTSVSEKETEKEGIETG